MRADKIIEAMGQIDDSYLSAAINSGKQDGRKARERTKRYTYLKWAAMIAVVIGISFVAAFTANAQFREWIISLFQFQETEEVPAQTVPAQEKSDGMNDGDGHIDLYAADTLEEVFDVQYLQSDSYLDMADQLFYYVDGEGNTLFYAAVQNEFVPVPSARIEAEVSMLGVSGRIDYDYCRYQGKPVIRERERDRFETDKKSDAQFLLSVSNDNQLILTLYKNPQRDEYSYSAVYDMDTGKIRDLFSGISVDGREIKDYAVLRSWEDAGNGLYTAALGNEMENTQIYLIDTSKKQAVSMRDLTGITDISSVKAADGKLLIGEDCPDGTFNYYCYDYSENTCLTLYDHAQYWQSEVQEQDGLKVKFSGGRYDCVMEAGRIYLVDEVTGKRMSVEGLTEELAESIIVNEADDKVLVSAFSEEEISRIGVIDVKKEVFYLLERKNRTGAHEYSIGWNGDSIMINAAAVEGTKSYVYLYTLR